MLALPMSAMVFTSGYVAGSHMIICGFFSKPDSMAMVGNLAEFWMASSVYTYPSRMLLSVYI